MWIIDFIKKLFKEKVIWDNKSSTQMTQEDWIEYAAYKKWIVEISHKVPINGESIVLKFKDKFFRIRNI